MTKIGIIGGGNMGSALIRGIYKKYKIIVCETDKRKAAQLRRQFKVAIKDLISLVREADVIILAVKPQDIDRVLVKMAGKVSPKQSIISIAAGITSAYIEKRLGEKKLGCKVKVIRTMPNLPVQIKEGITAISKGKYASRADIQKAHRIFDCVGRTVVVPEKQLEAITAVSGSGPAYVFLFAEIFMQAAKSLGLEQNLSRRLIEDTFSGSIGLLKQQKEDAAVLRKKVTSKAGTTEAALKVLWSAKIGKLFQRALQAAKKRAGELARK